MPRSIHILFPAVMIALVLPLSAATAGDKAKADVNGIPPKVMDALKARFPNAEIHKWSKEKERGVVLYDIEFRQGGNNLEADIRQDGTLTNWEREIPIRDLPAAVRKAVESRYPKGAIRQAMATTEVKAGKDVPEGYEVTLETAGGKTVELTAAPGGKVIEDSRGGK